MKIPLLSFRPLLLAGFAALFLATLSASAVPGAVESGFDSSVNGEVISTAVQPDGKVLIGGTFSTVDGVTRNNMARLNTDGSLDNGFNPNVIGDLTGVNAMAVLADGKILIAGGFTNVAGVARDKLALLNADGTLAPGFDITINGQFLNILVLPDGRFLIGGEFLTTGGVTRRGIVRFNANGTLDASFDANVNGDVFTIALQPDGKILIGGFLTTVGGQARNGLARVNANGTLDTLFNPDVDGEVVSATVQPDGKILIGGFIFSVGGVTRNTGFARLNANGTLDSGFDPGANGDVSSTVLQTDGKIVMVGLFTSLGVVTRNYVARLNSNGTLDPAFNPNANNEVFGTMAQGDGQIVIGGTFTRVGAVTLNRVARLLNDPATQSLTVPTASRVQWLRGGASPETLQVTFELSIDNGNSWTLLGPGTRISGGWERTGLSLPGSGRIRARARTVGGSGNGSSGLLETVTDFGTPVVVVPPGIVRQPVSQTVSNGATVRFSVQAGGSAPLSYQWQRNGVPVPGGTAAELVIPNASAANDGTYAVVISNSGGSATSAGATLAVLSPPIITSQPQSRLNVNGGEQVTFSVTATGGAPLSYQWRLNGIRIPGATGSTYTIPSITPSDAGNYSVAVANPVGAVNSATALLTLQGPTVQAPDSFASPEVLEPFGGFGNGNSAGKTKEAGEPNHAGKPGGSSVWYSWQAPQNGVATFSTAGSSFDTLLAVYTGTSLSTLGPVVSDDDGGGFFTSLVRFNAVAGTTYLIAVDGLAGAGGNFFLSWSQDSGGDVPVITAQPVSEAVVAGDTVVFSVTAQAQTPLTYQWFYNGDQIAGATGPTLTRANVQPDMAGSYVVAVTASGRTVLSRAATLEIGAIAGAVTEDKFEDVLIATPAGASVRALVKSAFAPPVAGALGTQVLETFGATKQQGEPNHCGVLGGASRWFRVQPGVSGILELDTLGSEIDTVLAVYTGNALTNLTLVSCDNDSAPDGRRSRVNFPATQGVNYLVAIDGVDGAEGRVQLNYKLGLLPAITEAPADQSTGLGSTVAFRVGASATPPPTFQWSFNGIQLAGETNSTLTIANVQAANLGTYSVEVRSIVGSVVSSANLALLGPNEPPRVTLTSPANGTAFAPGASITLTASASGNNLTKVEFFQNARKIGEDITPPFSVVWNGVAAGNYTLTAKATDAARRIATSLAVKIVADNKPPTITIAAPLANARISNSVATIRGTALDNGVVAQVLVQVNGDPFTPATGTLKWTNQVTLAPGTNSITAKAVDALGLQSVPMVRKIIFVVTEPLNLDDSGTGTLTPNLGSKQLEIGKSYKMVARPGVGFLFERWEVGGTETNHPTLNFVMRSNLVVNVRFIPNPFIPVKGSYNGLFFDENQPKHESAGLATLTTTDKGTFSGSLLMGTTKIPLTGQFALNGFVRKTVVRTGKPSLTVDLWLDVSNQTDQVTGTVSDGTWTASLSADRATFNTQTNPAPFRDKFTHLIPGAQDSTSFPGGDGYGILTIDRAGKLAPKGALGDGALVTQSAIVSRHSRWPMYHGLYRGTGSIFGWVTFSNATDYAANLVWTKPASGTDALYRLGFTNRVDLVGRSYVTPPAGTPVFTWSNGVAVLDGGNLNSPLSNNVATAGARLNIATNDARKLTLTVNAANGSLVGSFIHPGTGRSAAIKGVVLKPLDIAGGFFPGTNQTGEIRLKSRP